MPSQRKSHVFKATGLSRELSDEELETSLRKTLQEEFTDDERSQIIAEISIVPDCKDDRARVALIQFVGRVPEFLSKLAVNPLEGEQIEMRHSHGKNDINFDCNFFGFTQLYMPDYSQPVAAE